MKFWPSISRFLTSMDAKAGTSLLVSVALLLFLVFLFVFGESSALLAEGGAVRVFLADLAGSPWAVFAVMAAFALLALIGAPQFVLIGVTVSIFGPRDGAIYAWAATMASATLTFAIGHFLGAGWLERMGERVTMLVAFLGRHGILASALIRVVPSAPFIVVNAAAGAARIPLWKYWAGSGVGIVPKIALVAALGAVASADGPGGAAPGEGAISAFLAHWGWKDLVLLLVIIGLWLVFIMFVRRLYLRLRSN